MSLWKGQYMEQTEVKKETVKNDKKTKMFCYQCQETAGNKGCTVSGMCGKVPEVANIQDLLIYVTKGLSAVTTKLREQADRQVQSRQSGAEHPAQRLDGRNQSRLLEREQKRKHSTADAGDNGDENEFEKKAKEVGIVQAEDENIRSLRSLITYGIKGIGS